MGDVLQRQLPVIIKKHIHLPGIGQRQIQRILDNIKKGGIILHP